MASWGNELPVQDFGGGCKTAFKASAEMADALALLSMLLGTAVNEALPCRSRQAITSAFQRQKRENRPGSKPKVICLEINDLKS